MRVCEWLAAGYLAYLMAVALVRPVGTARRIWVWMGALAGIGSVVAAGKLPHTPVVAALRDWLPGAHILVAYYFTGQLFTAPMPTFEGWLQEWDRRLLGDPVRAVARLPYAVRATLSALYSGCFVIVAAGFAVVWLATPHPDVDRFWSLVYASEAGAFGFLPWLRARPPWVVEPTPVEPGAIHHGSLWWVRHTSIGVNTFPSGHTSGSLAVAIAVYSVWPAAGSVFFLLAACTAAGCVSGRFHYVADIITGVALATVLAVAIRVVWPL